MVNFGCVGEREVDRKYGNRAGVFWGGLKVSGVLAGVACATTVGQLFREHLSLDISLKNSYPHSYINRSI